MSLLTRLWLAVATSMLLALIGGFGVTVLTARDYLVQQLFAQGQDGAGALALALSQQGTEPAAATVLVSALFDGGHFERVVFRDVAGKLVAERVNDAPPPDVPRWFVDLVPLKTPAGKHEVSSGWKPAGEVEVQANSRFAHAALWQGVLHLAIVMGLLALVFGAAMTLVVRWIKRPLERLVAQAEAIGEGRFAPVEQSEVPEFRVVSTAMNTMGNRVAAMFGEQAARLEGLREAANRDEVSGLPNRGWFVGRLRELLHDEAAAEHGVVLLVRVGDLGGINRRLGRGQGDALVRAIARILHEQVGSQSDAVLARLNGADFAILLPGIRGEVARERSAALEHSLAELEQQDLTDVHPLALVAGAIYRRGELPADVLARADSALMERESGQAPKLEDPSSGPDTAHDLSPDAWRDLLDRALSERRFALASYPVVGADGRPVHREVMLRLLPVGEGQVVNAARFVPAAIRLDRIAAIDLAAVQLALDEMLLQLEDVAVNLSAVSIQQDDFIEALVNLLRSAFDRAHRLWIEVSERNLSDTHGIADMARLSSALAPFRCHLGIDHFGRDFAALPRLYEVKVDYLKIDGSFVADVHEDPGNQRFIKSMVDVASSLGIAVHAEGVTSDAEWETLERLGVVAMTGPAAGRHQSA